MTYVSLFEYSHLLERVLSTAIELKYSLKALETLIANSSFFRKIEKMGRTLPPTITDVELIKDIFVDINVDISKIPEYVQCDWIAEAYITLQDSTHFTFETIFIYLPIAKMVSLFALYHEMSFSEIVNYFNDLYKEKSVLEILMDSYGYSIRYVSNITGIPYSTIFNLKKRRRDIKKVSVDTVACIAKIFNVRVETIAELQTY